MSTFVPDHRNLGGQGVLTNLLTNHYASLLNAKPVVNSHETPKKSGAKPRKNKDLLEVIVAFNKQAKVTAYTDSSKPETLNFASKLSEYKQRKQKSKINDHPKELLNLKNRIERYDKPIEKKKNEFNHIENPVVLFRNSKDSKGGITVIKNRKNGDVYEMMKKSVSKPIKKNQAEVNLKEILLNEIINNNIWTDDDINALFERVKEDHKNLPMSDLEEAIEFIRQSVLNA